MDIHADKTLFKVIAIILIIALIPVFGWGYVVSGFKGLIFAGWLFINLFLFLFIIAWTVDRGTKISSKGFISSYVDIWLNMSGYTLFLLTFFALAVIASFYVWGFLNTYPPLNEDIAIPASVMPSPQRY